MKRRSRAGLIIGVLGLALGAVGLAHTAAGVRLLRRASGSDACPFGGGAAEASPAERRAARQAALVDLRGPRPSRSRPAFGFALQASSRAAIQAWARAQAVRCLHDAQRQRLECTLDSLAQLPADGVAAPGTVFFNFDPAERLRSVVAMAYVADAAVAIRARNAQVAAVQDKVGPVAQERGQATSDYLAAATFRQVASEFRFQDYHVDLTATNMGPQAGYILQHRVQTLVD